MLLKNSVGCPIPLAMHLGRLLLPVTTEVAKLANERGVLLTQDHIELMSTALAVACPIAARDVLQNAEKHLADEEMLAWIGRDGTDRADATNGTDDLKQLVEKKVLPLLRELRDLDAGEQDCIAKEAGDLAREISVLLHPQSV